MIRGAFDDRRAAQASVATLIAVPVLLLLVGMVIYVVLARDARTETQNGSDAAALAAARALATDDLLTADPVRAAARIRRARAAAVRLGMANVAGGERLTFDPNEANDPDGDIVFGYLDRPLDGTFTAATPDNGGAVDWVGARVNAVLVNLRRPPVRPVLGGDPPDREVLGHTIAMLDFSVVGFRPLEGATVPLMPIGLFTDHTGEADYAWDAHLRPGNRTDEWQFDPEKKTFSPGRDGIPEVRVLIGQRPKPTPSSDTANRARADAKKVNRACDDVPGMLLQVGVDSFAETVNQVEVGCGGEQLREKFGSGFVLTEANILDTPGTPNCPPPGPFDEALRRVIASGEPRIWPLFTEVDADHGLVRVSGWVGARVVAAERHPGGGVLLVLQPAVICHTATVTERRASPPAFWANNQTVCRVRLAE